jgi:hypothetical protein
MKLLRIAAVGAGLAWFIDGRRGPERRARAAASLRGLAGRARAMLENAGLDLGARRGGPDASRGAPGGVEVREGKSPAELAAGARSGAAPSGGPGARDAPRPAHGALPGEQEPTAEDYRHGDVTRRVELSGPPQGSHVTAAHLGVPVPRQDLEAPARGLRASDDDDAEETARRREPDER